MTTQADRDLLARIERFDKSPRSVVLMDPAQIVRYEGGQWQLGLVNIGQPVSITPESFPVQAGVIDIERILAMIPAPNAAQSAHTFTQKWAVTIERSEGDPIVIDVEATGSRLGILMAGIEFAKLQLEQVPVSVEIIEAR